MTSMKENHIETALKGSEKNIKIKRALVSSLEAEYKNICKKNENSVKELQALTTKLYNVEGFLKTAECRHAEYQKKESEWQQENLKLKEKVDQLKKSLEEATQSAHSDDAMFNQKIKQLVEESRKDRGSYDSNESKQFIKDLQSKDRAINQEIHMLNDMLNRIKGKNAFCNSEDVEFILENANLGDLINEEIGRLQKTKEKCLKLVSESKEQVRLLKEETKKLSNKA